MLSLVPQREASMLAERAPWADRFQMHLQNTATEAMPVGTPPRSFPTCFHFMVIPLTLGEAERYQ